MSQPYRFSEMLHHLQRLTSANNSLPRSEQILIQHEDLCESIAKFAVPLLTITSCLSEKDQKKAKFCESSNSNKKIAFIIARQHPGETVSSFLMEGLLDFLCSPCEEAVYLRSKYIFKIIPMFNPDGVVFGSFRCNLSGSDLNRQWMTPHKLLHPSVYSAKKLIQQYLQMNLEIDYFVDLHGHSKKLNSFAFACKLDSDPLASSIFPMMLSKLNPIYHFPSCTFGLETYKENTARGIAWNIGVNKPNIFTIETSFFGKSSSEPSGSLQKTPQKGVAFDKEDLRSLGRDLCRAMFVYHIEKKSSLENIDQQLKLLPSYLSAGLSLAQITNDVKEAEDNHLYQEGGQLEEALNSGSDSDPLADELETETKIKKLFGKKIAQSLNLLIPSKPPRGRTSHTPIKKSAKKLLIQSNLDEGVDLKKRRARETINKTLQSSTVSCVAFPTQEASTFLSSKPLVQAKPIDKLRATEAAAANQCSFSFNRPLEQNQRAIEMEERRFRIKNMIHAKSQADYQLLQGSREISHRYDENTGQKHSENIATVHNTSSDSLEPSMKSLQQNATDNQQQRGSSARSGIQKALENQSTSSSVMISSSIYPSSDSITGDRSPLLALSRQNNILLQKLPQQKSNEGRTNSNLSSARNSDQLFEDSQDAQQYGSSPRPNFAEYNMSISKMKANAKRQQDQSQQKHALIANFTKILKENTRKYKFDTKILCLTRAESKQQQQNVDVPWGYNIDKSDATCMTTFSDINVKMQQSDPLKAVSQQNKGVLKPTHLRDPPPQLLPPPPPPLVKTNYESRKARSSISSVLGLVQSTKGNSTRTSRDSTRLVQPSKSSSERSTNTQFIKTNISENIQSTSPSPYFPFDSTTTELGVVPTELKQVQTKRFLRTSLYSNVNKTQTERQ